VAIVSEGALGVVSRHDVVHRIDQEWQLRRSGKPRVEALVEGCDDRLRPILMTAIATIFGLLPLAFSGFTVATAYIESLAVVVIGGLASSTFFTLLALPVWYTTVEDIGSVFYRSLPRRRRRRGRERQEEEAVSVV
jgi:HAE1 family hydrophobic/amphiphilic exporter-1